MRTASSTGEVLWSPRANETPADAVDRAALLRAHLVAMIARNDTTADDVTVKVLPGATGGDAAWIRGTKPAADGEEKTP